MADDKKTISPDVGTPTEAPEQPDPAPDLADTAAPAPLGPEDLTVEEQLILEHEGQAALFEMGEAIPDAPEFPGVTIPEQSVPDKDDKQTASPGKDDPGPAPTGKVVDFAVVRKESGKTTPQVKEATPPNKEGKKPEQPRRGRPSKGDKVAPGKTDPAKKDRATPAKPPKRDKMELLTKCLTIYYERKNGSKKDAHRRHPIHLIILFKFKAVAERRQWSSAASKPRRKTRVKLCPHF